MDNLSKQRSCLDRLSRLRRSLAISSAYNGVRLRAERLELSISRPLLSFVLLDNAFYKPRICCLLNARVWRRFFTSLDPERIIKHVFFIFIFTVVGSLQENLFVQTPQSLQNLGILVYIGVWHFQKRLLDPAELSSSMPMKLLHIKKRSYSIE